MSWMALGCVLLCGYELVTLVPARLPCASTAAGQRRRVTATRTGGPRLRVVGRVRSGIQPKSVAVSPDGSRIFVCNFGRPDRDNVMVYDSRTLAHVGTIEFEGNAVETAFSPDGRTVYVSNFRRGVVEVVDARTLRVQREVRVGNNPKVIVVSPDGSRLYVANWSSDDVTEVDTRTWTVTRTRRTGRHPRGMVLADGGQSLYVAAMYEHVMHVFDRGARAERDRFTPCNYPRHLVLSPDESRLYASCSCCRQVRAFDRASHRLLAIMRTGENPRTVDISSNGRYLAVADYDDNTVTMIDTVQMRHRVSTIARAERIVGVAIQPGDRIRVYATSWMTGELLVLEPPGQPALATAPPEAQP